MLKKSLIISFLLFVLFSIYSSRAEAGPGDTTVVQFFTFGSTRDSVVFFPPATNNYEKILMYYTLKCNPPCGEWDYLTYTYLMDHTGVMDSTIHMQPNFMVNGSTPDSLIFMHMPSWQYDWKYQYFNQTAMTDSGSIGNGNYNIGQPGCTCSQDARMLFLWKGSELTSAGLTAGNLTALRFNFTSLGAEVKNLRLRLKYTILDSLTISDVADTMFTLVYEKHTSFTQTGWNTIFFTWPFYWNGTSNILLELVYTDHASATPYALKAEATPQNKGIAAINPDYYLDFNTPDLVTVPVGPFVSIDSAITVSFWAYGDPAVLPKNTVAFEGRDINNNRVLNVHLPWNNSNIYWDAGNTGSTYDRIYKTATVNEIEGQWNHWAFTKNVQTGLMKIFLNGQLWHSGTGMTRLMTGITTFTIGANYMGTNNWDGIMDEFRVWNTALPENVIRDYMYRDVDSLHPYYNNLVAYYNFNEGTALNTFDVSPNNQVAQLIGLPEWKKYKGYDRFRNFETVDARPNVVFEKGNYNPATMDSVFVLDSIQNALMMIVMFEDTLHPYTNIPTDTLYKYPAYYNNYVFDTLGNVIDSALVMPDSIIYKSLHPYWDHPYEVVNTFELARYITPYGNGLDLGDGFTWVFDVTDYRLLLTDSVHITAGNNQELLDLKFLMIEGTPEREVIKFEQLWRGTYYLNNLDQTLAPRKVKLDPAAKTFRLKTRASGHDFDNATNCAEFCPKIHSVMVNGVQVDSWQILQECADNALYPQGGTWIYDRAGWCPGAKVTTRDVEITDYVVLNDSNIIDYNSQSDPYGNYRFAGQLISYSDPNFSNNASIEDILTPNSMKIFGRLNPMCGSPKIRIKNSGANNLTSLSINYGYVGSVQTYQWTGNLKFTDSEVLTLDPVDWSGWTGDRRFYVKLNNPNGNADEYPFNDSMSVSFDTPPEFPNTIIIWLKTNNAAYETSYTLKDVQGNTVFSRSGLTNNTWYKDTLTLSLGCYTFTLKDTDDDGISFWNNNDGSGSCAFRKSDGAVIKVLQPDFGKEISFEFTVGFLLNTEETAYEQYFEIFPNPTDGLINVAYAFDKSQDVSLIVRDVMGRFVKSQEISDTKNDMIRIQLDAEEQGIYFVSLINKNGITTKKVLLTR